jgi:hypothetical protein
MNYIFKKIAILGIILGIKPLMSLGGHTLFFVELDLRIRCSKLKECLKLMLHVASPNIHIVLANGYITYAHGNDVIFLIKYGIYNR